MSPATTRTVKGELSLPSFRKGISFKPTKPDVDGFINIMDAVGGPQGVMLKAVGFEVLKRSFEDVTEAEVGKMEFEDFVPLLKIGMEGLKEIEALGFTDDSAN